MSDDPIPFDGASPESIRELTSRGIQVDVIHLDDFRVKAPSGKEITPFRGGKVWCFGYGRSTAEDAAWADRVAAADEGQKSEVLRLMCRFLAGELLQWNLRSPRTGEEMPQPRDNADAVAALPQELIFELFNRVMGKETVGEGGGGSGS